jgi:putative serine protease PepD
METSPAAKRMCCLCRHDEDPADAASQRRTRLHGAFTTAAQRLQTGPVWLRARQPDRGVQQMNVSPRARTAAGAAALAAVIGVGGFTIGAATAEPGHAASPSAAAVQRPGEAGHGYADVVREVLPSVVLIRTDSGLGSGVVLDAVGNIVTNAHVTGGAARMQVQLSGDPKPRQARLVGTYPAGDLAVIRVDDPAGMVPASFGDSDKAQVGDVVLAVGNPLGLSGSVTEGIVSATSRVVTEPASASSSGTVLPGAIQTSAPINPGNSGGALVSTSGRVIGIPTAAATGAQGSQAQGIGFAIPANLARDIAGQLITSGHVTSTHRAAIGAQITSITGADGSQAGAGIVAVTPGGPADRAGLRAGDVITSLGAAPTPEATALTEVLAAREPGQTVAVTVDRGGQTLTRQLELGELPGR